MKHSILLIAVLLVFGCSTDSENDPIVDSIKMMDTEEEEEVIVELTGDFIDGAHPTSGIATISADRKKLNLSGFKTDAGPLLEFYIATDLDGLDYVSLGELQGLEGAFIYDLPDGINFETHKYLMVWCVDFSVSFGHAILE